jgi:hypothetical protein
LRGETERALKDLHRARAIRPGDSNILANVCRFSQAAGLSNLWPFVNEAIRIDPLYPIAWFGPAFTNHLYGHFQEAVAPRDAPWSSQDRFRHCTSTPHGYWPAPVCATKRWTCSDERVLISRGR